MKLENIFPSPIAIFEYDKSISKDLLNFINLQEKKHNLTNIKSSNTFILNHEYLKDILYYINNCVQQYFQDIYAPPEKTIIKITQSWINWTKKGGFHHKHYHSNSLISGCFYINADRESDRICFFNPKNPAIKISPQRKDKYTAEAWSCPVGTGDIIIFPSYLNHMVEIVPTTDIRISIAFNCFPFGELGEEEALTSLVLNGDYY